MESEGHVNLKLDLRIFSATKWKEWDPLSLSRSGEEACCRLACFTGVDHVVARCIQTYLGEGYKVFWRRRRNEISFTVFFALILFKNVAALSVICWGIPRICDKNIECYVYLIPLFFVATVSVLFLTNTYCMECEWILKMLYAVENNCVFCATASSSPIFLDPISESKRYDARNPFFITMLHYHDRHLDYLQSNNGITRIKIALFTLPKEKQWHQPIGCDAIDLLRPQLLAGPLQSCSIGILIALCEKGSDESNSFVCFLEKSGYTILFHQPNSMIAASKEDGDNTKKGSPMNSGSPPIFCPRPWRSVGDEEEKVCNGIVSISIIR